MRRLSLFAVVLAGCASANVSRADDDPAPDAPPNEPPIDAPDQPPPPCTPSVNEVLANPALDLAPPGVGWVDGRDPRTNMLSGGPFPIVTANLPAVAPNSAPNKAWFGGAAGGDVTPAAATLTDTLAQTVTFPADATGFVVSGVILVGTNESGGTVFDTFTIDVIETNGAPIENVMTANNTTAAGSFTPFSKTLTSNLAGRTVQLRLVSVNDDVLLTNFFIDTLSFQATFCP